MKFFRYLFLLIAVVFLVFGGGLYWIYSSVGTSVEHAKSNDYIVIERGSTPAQIIAKLANEGIIRSQMPVMIYLRTVGDASKLQAGEYRFASPISPLQVLKETI